MTTGTFNPYPIIGEQFHHGMDSIVKRINNTSTVDDLVQVIDEFIAPIYFPSAPLQVQLEIKSVAYHIINSYNNNPQTASLFYGPKQSHFIDLMLGLKTEIIVPINAISLWLLDIEDNVTKSVKNIFIISVLILGFTNCRNSTPKFQSFEINQKGDTINVTDKEGKKQGVWINTKKNEVTVSSDTVCYKDNIEIKKPTM